MACSYFLVFTLVPAQGVYGPPSGKKYVIFVDDVNMPQREKYFAQPPIELLRQWMDHGGWYERKPPCPFRAIVDTQFVGSMGPPGGGRNPVTNRFLRHFNFISFTEMSDSSVMRIFTTILGAFFKWVCSDSGLGGTGSCSREVQVFFVSKSEQLICSAQLHIGAAFTPHFPYDLLSHFNRRHLGKIFIATSHFNHSTPFVFSRQEILQ